MVRPVGVVNFNGVLMQGTSQPTRAGFYFTTVKDWYSLPEAKTEVRERPLADGAFGFSSDYRLAVTVTVEGFYLANTRAELQLAKRQLSMAALGPQVPLTVTDEDGPTTRRVSVRRLPIADDHGALMFAFAIDTLSTDPRRYSLGPNGDGSQGVEVVSTGLPASGTGIVYPIVYPITYGTPGSLGRVTVHNTGTALSFSVLEVTGGLSGGFELREVSSGNRLRFERVVPVGSTVTLNPRTGRASLDGPDNDVTGYLTVQEWWSVPPGAAQEIQFNAIGTVTGTPTLTARTPSAY